MALNLGVLEEHELKPKITVFGVGGAGGNAVNNMINKNLEGADFVVANTDAQALEQSRATRRIQLGGNVTQGLGAGMRPDVGRESAEESIDEIIDHLSGANMCFITAGMGGGTGTGAAPVIAKAARELGVLTVGVVTKPFSFEGSRRMSLAEQGLDELQEFVDTLIIIPNQNLFRIATENTTIMDAFNLADDVLYQGVKGVTDLMVMPGLINLDFADVRTVMSEMGKAMMGTGEAEGEGRAVHAAEKAIANPLLDDVSLHGSRGVLINITGGYDLKLFEVDEAANRIKQEVDGQANIIVGSCFDQELEGMMRVSVVATGIEAEVASEARRPQENARSSARPGARRAYPAVRTGEAAASSAAIRPAQRHAVRRAVTTAPAAAATAAVLDEDFDIDPATLETPEPETETAAQPNASPQDAAAALSQAEQPVAAPEPPKRAIPTVVDPSVAEPPQSRAPGADQEGRGLASGGMSFIRRVADSFTRTEEAKTPPFREKRLDEESEDKDGQLQIPAFLRRQAN